MATTVTVYDGAGVIGGNKILLEAEGAGLFLDFGTAYATMDLYYEEFLQPRTGRGLLDYLVMGLLPPLDGVYRPDLAPPGIALNQVMQRSPHYRPCQVQGVVLSHAHMDHSGAISFLRPDIPLYTGALTAVIAKAIQDTSSSRIESEITRVTPRDMAKGLKDEAPLCLEASNYRKGPAQQRPLNLIEEAFSPVGLDFWFRGGKRRGLEAVPVDTTHAVGGMTLRRFPVDHSIPGASAFAIETPAGWVVYSGDLRTHGAQGEATRRFVEEAARLRPMALICEGTHADEREVPGEQEVAGRCLEAAVAEKGLLMADFGPRNVERLLVFRQIASHVGRKLVILPKDAYLLEAMRAVDPSLPNLAADPDILLYREAKVTLATWERSLLEAHRSRLVYASDVSRDPGGYLLCFSFFDVNELPDLNPEAGTYIYSSSEAYDEEQHLDVWRLKNWLDRFHVRLVGMEVDTARRRSKPIPGYHTSGHISGAELLSLIREIRPQRLIPVHTENPGFFLEKLAGEMDVIIPERGVPIKIA